MCVISEEWVCEARVNVCTFVISICALSWLVCVSTLPKSIASFTSLSVNMRGSGSPRRLSSRQRSIVCARVRRCYASAGMRISILKPKCPGLAKDLSPWTSLNVNIAESGSHGWPSSRQRWARSVDCVYMPELGVPVRSQAYERDRYANNLPSDNTQGQA